MNKQDLTEAIHCFSVIYGVAEHFNCSTATIKNYMKKYAIITPKGFYSKGKKVGRPKGFKMSKEQKQLRSVMFSGKGNPFYGKKHSEQTKRLMSENHADFSGNKNPFKQSLEEPGKLDAHRARCKNTWASRDVSWRAEYSKRLSKAMVNSTKFTSSCLHKNHKSGHIQTKKAGKIFVRSSWEKRLALFLDDNADVYKFSLEAFYIPYKLSNGSERFSRVDFMLEMCSGLEILIEVKPKAIQKIKNNPYKIAGYKQFCKDNNIKFILVDEDYIFNLENLVLK